MQILGPIPDLLTKLETLGVGLRKLFEQALQAAV